MKNCVPIAYRDVSYDYIQQRVGNIMLPDLYYQLRDHIYDDFNYMHCNDLGALEFAGGYPSNLHEEINNYSIIAGVVARTFNYDLNSAVFFLVRKFYMLRCLLGTLYVDVRCFGVSWVFSKHKIPHPNQWGILKPQRNTVYSRKTSE